LPKKISSFVMLATACVALTFGVAACNKTNIQQDGAQSQPAQTDNLAPVDGVQTADASYQQPATQTTQQNYQQPAPVRHTSSRRVAQQYAPNQNDPNYDSDGGYQDASYGQPVLQAQEPPPPLPQYSQPPCPGNGYLWTPGYWSYAPQGYFWVPGVWAWPPQVGFLWTPGYWGFMAGMYRYNYGSWGQYVGYYGGINYGFGYVGTGYQGGYWGGNRFNYNGSVNNINITNVSVYNRTITNTNMNRASYNGPGGITRRPMQAENIAMRGQRIPPMTTQLQHQQSAAQNHQQFASVNHGRPAVLTATRPIQAGRPIAPVIPARSVSQQHGQQQQRAQAQPQQHGQQQQRAQAQPQQHGQQQQRAQAQPQQHGQQQQRAQAQPPQQAQPQQAQPQQRAQAQPQRPPTEERNK
jgi:hypothetical protein